jgi:DNA (cytosine-5)-methyltransferase 1
MNHASLFSGIGGFDLAAHWMGWTNIFNCEIEPFPQRILNYHFPEAIQYGDIKQTDFSVHRGAIDILTGGFPCQPYSTAGKRLGKNDERHLFPDMLRAIDEIKPTWVVGENVRGLVSWNDGLVFEETQADLEAQGFEVQSFILPAAGINAPHKRDRVWIVAYAKGTGARQNKRGLRSLSDRRGEWKEGELGDNASNTTHDRRRGRRSQEREEQREWVLQGERQGREMGSETQGCGGTWEHFPTQPPICGGDDGIPRELDSITFPKWRRESIKGYGNAIVPQIAYRIFKSIEAYYKNPVKKSLNKKVLYEKDITS